MRRPGIDVHTVRGRRAAQAAALLGLSAAVFTALFTVGGFSSVVFASGSMAPSITEGSLAITRTVDASDVARGDVVSVTAPDGERVTHRVVGVEELPWITALSLQGDANQSADPAPYLVETADEVVLSVPYLGRWSGAAGPLLGGMGVVLVALVIRNQSRRPRHRAPGGPTGARTAAGLLTSVGVVTALLWVSTPTSAYWTDTGTATSGEFSTTASIAAPASQGCAVHDNHIDATWTNVGQRFNYRATLHRLDGTQVGGFSSPPYAGELNSVSQLTRHIYVSDFGISPSDLGFPTQFNFNVRIYAQPFGSTATSSRWLSSSFATVPIRFESVSGTNYQMRCGHDLNTTVDITGIGTDTGVSAADQITNAATNTVVGTGEPGSTISVRRAGTEIGTATVAANGTWSAGVTLSEGSADLTATATDVYGHTAQDTLTVVLDTIAPTATVTSTCTAANVGNPVAGQPGQNWCKQTTRSWSASYADNAGGSGLVPTTGSEYQNNGGGWLSYTGAVAMAEANGRVMQARATDRAGNTSTTSNTYYIDGTAPAVTITAPPSGTNLTALSVRNAVTAACGANKSGCGALTDTISGPVSARWRIERAQVLGGNVCMNAAGTYAATTCAAGTNFAVTRTGNTWSIDVAPTSAYPFFPILSTYTVTISGATDAAGNVSTATATRSFTTVL